MCDAAPQTAALTIDANPIRRELIVSPHSMPRTGRRDSSASVGLRPGFFKKDFGE
jgi:hypothetical protein